MKAAIKSPNDRCERAELRSLSASASKPSDVDVSRTTCCHAAETGDVESEREALSWS